ncbi:hypothetical protein EP7_001947 [Isosphaeraceae bacterium EP7]
MRYPARAWLIASVISLLGAGLTPAQGGELVNGDFSNGLFGWVVSDPSYVTVSNGKVTLAEHPIDQEVFLYQDFTLPVGAPSLSFTIAGLTSESDGDPPNAFGAALIDPLTSLSLVPTVDSMTDSFYIRDLVSGVSQGDAAAGVTVSPAADALPLTISVAIAGPLGGQNARILFRLLSGGTATGSSVTLDGVTLAAVPEPGGIVLLATGLACVAALSTGRLTRLRFPG